MSNEYLLHYIKKYYIRNKYIRILKSYDWKTELFWNIIEIHHAASSRDIWMLKVIYIFLIGLKTLNCHKYLSHKEMEK